MLHGADRVSHDERWLLGHCDCSLLEVRIERRELCHIEHRDHALVSNQKKRVLVGFESFWMMQFVSCFAVKVIVKASSLLLLDVELIWDLVTRFLYRGTSFVSNEKQEVLIGCDNICCLNILNLIGLKWLCFDKWFGKGFVDTSMAISSSIV